MARKPAVIDDLELTREIVRQKFGDNIDFGLAIVSQDLNLLTLRGSASLASIAVASGPDTYDEFLNPSGTQRELKKWHADECYEYAINAPTINMIEEPRAFPEVMLNLTDVAAVEFYDPDDHTQVFDFNSAMTEDEVERKLLGVRFVVDALEFPKAPYKPQLSRIDGNHRLSGMDEHLKEYFDGDLTDEDIPFVPYSLFVGLKNLQETRLFNVVNDKHEGMDPALIDTQQAAITDPEKLRTDEELQPLWLTGELMSAGHAFEKMVSSGGSKEGWKKNDIRPLLKRNTLRSAITLMLREGKAEATKLRKKPDLLLRGIDNYWKAVKHMFPEPWRNKRDFILLQTIGLNGFAMLGGDLLRKAVEAKTLDEQFFRAHLAPIAEKDMLGRKDGRWTGVAGAGGAKKVYDELSGSMSETDSSVHELEERYGEARTLEDDINELPD